MGKIYKGDIGTIILVDVGTDISAATDTKIVLRKPDLSEKELSATIQDSTKLKSVVGTGDLDQAGAYNGQAKLTLGSWTGRGETFSFTVYDLYG